MPEEVTCAPLRTLEELDSWFEPINDPFEQLRRASVHLGPDGAAACTCQQMLFCHDMAGTSRIHGVSTCL
jgi:hypothetical protein